MNVNQNSELYDKLTYNDVDNSLNFLESLNYISNSNELIRNLNSIKEKGISFEIVKGFVFKEIEDNSEFNEFRTCIIECKEDICDFNFVEKINENQYKVTI